MFRFSSSTVIPSPTEQPAGNLLIFALRVLTCAHTDELFKDPHTTKKYYTFIIHYTGVYFNSPKSEINVPQPSVDGLFTGLFSIIVFLIKFIVISIPTAAYISVRMQKRPGKSPNRFRIPLLIFL